MKKERRGLLTATIEQHSKGKEKELDEGLEEGSLDNFWKLSSEASENGYLEVLTGQTKQIRS